MKRFGTPYLLGSLLICAVVTLVKGIDNASMVQRLGDYHYASDGTDMAVWYSGWATALFILCGLSTIAAVAVGVVMARKLVRSRA